MEFFAFPPSKQFLRTLSKQFLRTLSKQFLHPPKKQSLRRKLFWYMLLFAVLLLLLLLTTLTLLGTFTGTGERVTSLLQFQTTVFEQQINTYFDNLAVMSVQLSETLTEQIDTYLTENDISFAALNDDEGHIEQLQEVLIEPLRHKLWEADCTGAFMLLDAQVNSTIEDAAVSRTGIYLQRNSLETVDSRVLLYRGLAHVGKAHDCMPHRKWRLEFRTDVFPAYDTLKAEASFPLRSSYRISDVVLLPGTDQHVCLMTIPLLRQDGTFLGLCGFEISEGYFKQTFAQPSELEHAIFCISPCKNGLDLANDTLSAGVRHAYYLEPSGDYQSVSRKDGLTVYTSETDAYIGITKEIDLCPGNGTTYLSVLIPKQDYDDMVFRDLLRGILLFCVFLVAALTLTFYFTKRYIQPIKQDLAQIRQKKYTDATAHTTETDDLFAFLTEQDRIHAETLTRAESEKAQALSAAEEMQDRYAEATKTAERLAYSRKDEIDPYEYENFKAGLQTLTEKEREVFELYLSGKTAKEIAPLLHIQESTLKYHNHNMLGKLGVSSRKQMLRFAALLQQEQGT